MKIIIETTPTGLAVTYHDCNSAPLYQVVGMLETAKIAAYQKFSDVMNTEKSEE